jgi:M6 family metalloprotease-like protein
MAALAALLAVSGAAAPARGVEQAFEQPGAGVFYGTTCGDELFHYVRARDGAVLTEGEDGLWYYAGTDDRYLLDLPAEPVDEDAWVRRQMAEHPAPDRSALLPAPRAEARSLGPQSFTGEQRLLVILVDFKDTSIRYEELWAGLVFGAADSVKSFYGDATCGAIGIVPARENYAGAGAADDGVVRVELNYNHPDEGDARTARDAIRAAAAYTDFAPFDRNGDKRVTPDELHILVVCAGYEASYDDRLSPSVWGHHSSEGLSSYGALAGGKTFTGYCQVGEVHRSLASAGHVSAIGILCHELGHDLGLPDLYGNGHSRGLGGFSLMSNGSWGMLPGQNQGDTPVFLDAYCLELLGVFPVVDIAPGTGFDGALESISTGSKRILRVQVPGSREYFLIENRQPELNDQAMRSFMRPAAMGGLAVYRIDTAYANNYEDGRQVALLVEADQGIIGYSRLQNNELTGTDPFYYVSGARPVRLNRATSPSTQLRGGGSAWFDFLCKTGPDTSMGLAVWPLLTASPHSLTLDYRSGTGKITALYPTGTPAFTSSDDSIVTVDPASGNVRAVPRGKGAVTITVSDDSDISDTVTVTVQYAWWQWVIVIFLFGWIWY